MSRYEYKVVPAPKKGVKGKGVKGPEARFSHAIEGLMNDLAAEGWEYQRAETLPSLERSGLTSTTTEWRNVLVFRRPADSDIDAFAPELLPAPDPVASAAVAAPALAGVTRQEPVESPADPAPADHPEEKPETPSEPAPETDQAEAEAQTEKVEKDAASAATPASDNGVEDTSDVSGVSASLTSLAASRSDDKSKD